MEGSLVTESSPHPIPGAWERVAHLLRTLITSNNDTRIDDKGESVTMLNEVVGRKIHEAG
jgi:hypothetical protein